MVQPRCIRCVECGFIGYVSFYASDILGLNVTIIGTMLMLSKVIDACTDLCMGYIIDKTNTPWGKARPYEVFIILEWGITIVMYSVPTIGGMYNVFPLICFIVMFVMALNYKMDDVRPQMKADLAARHEKQS